MKDEESGHHSIHDDGLDPHKRKDQNQTMLKEKNQLSDFNSGKQEANLRYQNGLVDQDEGLNADEN